MDTVERFDDAWFSDVVEDEAEEVEPRFIKIKQKVRLEDDKPKSNFKKNKRPRNYAKDR